MIAPPTLSSVQIADLLLLKTRPCLDPRLSWLHWTPSSPSADDLPVIALLPGRLPSPPGLPFPSHAKLDDELFDERRCSDPLPLRSTAVLGSTSSTTMGLVSVLHGTCSVLGKEQDQLYAAVLAFPRDQRLLSYHHVAGDDSGIPSCQGRPGERAKQPTCVSLIRMPNFTSRDEPASGQHWILLLRLHRSVKSSKLREDNETPRRLLRTLLSFSSLLTASTNAEGQMELGVLHPEL